MQKRVAVIIGHNEKQPGASALNPIGVSEYVFNSEVADEMIRKWRNIPEAILKVFRRFRNSDGYSAEIKETYGRVNAWNPDLSIELHFNGSKPDVHGDGRQVGTETLSSGTPGSLHAALVFQNTVVGRLGLPDRWVKKRTIKDRGGASLWLADCPSILTEPFFGDDADDVDKLWEESGGFPASYLAGVYCEAIQECLDSKAPKSSF